MVAELAAATAAAATAAEVDPLTVSPGIAGFLVTFVLALATWLLIRSMVGHLRRLRYSPDPAAQADDPASAPHTASAGDTAPAVGTAPTGDAAPAGGTRGRVAPEPEKPVPGR